MIDVKDIYQPILVGFAAVTLGLMANSILEWFKQWLSRKNETRALRAALVAELRSNLDNFNDRLGDNEGHSSQHSVDTVMMVPLQSHIIVYELSIAKIGFLDDNEIFSLIKAYDYIINTPKNFAILGKTSGDSDYRWAEVSIKYRNTLTNMEQRSVELIQLAISEIKKSNKMSKFPYFLLKWWRAPTHW